MISFEVKGMADEGVCEHCGANCPKRRVAVQPIDADGCRHDVQFIGVICAAKLRHRGSKAVRHQSQIVAEAQRADADREYHERRKLARVVTHSPFFIDLGFGKHRVESNPQNAANCLYRFTNRPIVGSFFSENADGHIVRVDGSDAADVQFYADRGFSPVSSPVQEAP